ncbi:family 78 glycoside hydrolase catalytic domain [Telluribacter sp.]|jgi:alpha-L-rhamnosidase|uniref:family 78 glycoside hydrolase catalytic domain n=1 Tax=Telluribacter sp. TaxID=1978767 RepID=UPI002E0E9B4A|nr:family 78 glycoside hydrolase catalytic domain [Telluribacter sp.]
MLITLMVWQEAVATDLKPINLRCEYRENPVIDVPAPRLNWVLSTQERNQKQSAYEIVVASSPDLLSPESADLWSSCPVKSEQTTHIEYQGKPLRSRQVCYWKVRSWDKSGSVGEWSDVARWEMGLLARTDWNAEWIGLNLNHLGRDIPYNGSNYHLPPAPYLRKEVQVEAGFVKARLYVTALGLYEFSINGQRVGHDYFTPGWTDYNKRVYYQTYDVTSLLQPGSNALGSVLSYGWYAGYLGYALLVGNPVVRAFYGEVPVLKAQLEVEYPDGRREVIKTDGSWRANQGALRETDILNGETYDARLELGGWQQPNYNDHDWTTSEVFADKADRLVEAYPANPVQVTGTLYPKSISERSENRYIFDMGQNFAGIVRIKVKGEAGDVVKLRFGEMLQDGWLVTENLRKARAIDTYILKGDPEGETWEPQFTFHGFQFVEISGLRNVPTTETITGLVLGSVTPQTGTFETDNDMVNKLYSNIDWTQRANFLDIPTDCPQRDERLGWTGDAQVYIRSAAYNRDVAAFFTKWMVDLNDAQWGEGPYNGAFPLYAPRPNVRNNDSYSPGWMEAGIICPYEIFRSYGDTRLLAKGWDNMVRFMDFLERHSGGRYIFKENSFRNIDPNGGFGDWLSLGKKSSPDLLATMYFGYSAGLMAEMAEALGKAGDAQRFREMHRKVQTALQTYYTNGSGQLYSNEAAYGRGDGYIHDGTGFTGHSQTAYANALYMNIIPKTMRPKAGAYLADLVRQNGGKMSIGFLGAKQLLPALSQEGHSDVAYQLFLRKEFPSWGFEVVNGATTIWERWDSMDPNGNFTGNGSMNSFSHYAFGAVCEWMFEYAAGIQPLQPGFKSLRIRPEIAKEGLTTLKATYQTLHGEVLSSWKKEGQSLAMEVRVPVNTTAEVHIPMANPQSVREGGQPVLGSSNWKVKGVQKGYLVVEVGSGYYQFSSQLP